MRPFLPAPVRAPREPRASTASKWRHRELNQVDCPMRRLDRCSGAARGARRIATANSVRSAANAGIDAWAGLQARRLVPRRRRGDTSGHQRHPQLAGMGRQVDEGGGDHGEDVLEGTQRHVGGAGRQVIGEGAQEVGGHRREPLLVEAGPVAWQPGGHLVGQGDHVDPVDGARRAAGRRLVRRRCVPAFVDGRRRRSIPRRAGPGASRSGRRSPSCCDARRRALSPGWAWPARAARRAVPPRRAGAHGTAGDPAFPP